MRIALDLGRALDTMLGLVRYPMMIKVFLILILILICTYILGVTVSYVACPEYVCKDKSFFKIKVIEGTFRKIE